MYISLIEVFWLIFLSCRIESIRIKIESLTIARETNISPNLINFLLLNGPYDLLAELLSLQSTNLKSIARSKCQNMTKSSVLNIFEEFIQGRLTDDQLKIILSADCVSQWSDELQDVFVSRFPNNLMESRDYKPSIFDPDLVLDILIDAWNQKDRKKIIWSHWTAKLSSSDLDYIYESPIWQRHRNLYQIFNFKNLKLIKISDVIGKSALINFIGLKGKDLSAFGIEELLQRLYTLISFIKIIEGQFSNSVIQNTQQYYEGIFYKAIKEISDNIIRIRSRIVELDKQMAPKLEQLFRIILDENFGNNPETDQLVNLIFDDFIDCARRKNLVVGDWLTGIFVIILDGIKHLSMSRIETFFTEFFARNPSIDAAGLVINFMKTQKCITLAEFDRLFERILIDRPDYYTEIYKEYPALLPRNLIKRIPLRLRILNNFERRFQDFEFESVFRFKYLKNSKIDDLRKFLEMLNVFKFSRFGINHICAVLRDDGYYYRIDIKEVIREYFELFLKNEIFYETIRIEKDSRPVLRLLPIFPVDLWQQFAFILTRANLLGLKAPFILEEAFFNVIYTTNTSPILLLELSTKLERIQDESLREAYVYLLANLGMSPDQIKPALWHLLIKIETFNIKSKQKPSRSRSENSINIPKVPELRKTKSSRDFHDTTENLHSFELYTYGFLSLTIGFQDGMNFDDFTKEEAHKILFNI